MSIVERLRGMDTYGYQSQLACEAADIIEELSKALDVSLETLQVKGCCGSECMSCTEARATLAKVQL